MKRVDAEGTVANVSGFFRRTKLLMELEVFVRCGKNKHDTTGCCHTAKHGFFDPPNSPSFEAEFVSKVKCTTEMHVKSPV